MTSLTLLAGRYKIGELIGSGGMAEVHIGLDQRLNRQVAIKILKPQLAEDPIFLARFKREAQSAASLNAPNIVAVYDSGEETSVNDHGVETHTPYIVMEYVHGKTLRDILTQEKKLSVDDAVEVLQGILSALTYSHKSGIIHRDIKPGNVMITNTGQVKVMDFGIARAVVDSAPTMTQSQGVVGTAQYLSPEQARGENVDFRSDLYSTGCVFFELLTGRPPFVGDSPVAIAYQHVREMPPKPSELNPEVNPVYDVIITKALAKDVNSRYADANMFMADLQNAIQGIPISSSFSDANATQVLTPDQVNEINGFTPSSDETVAMDSLKLGSNDFEEAINHYSQSDSAKAIEDELEEDSKKKRKIIIICSIVAVLAVAVIVAYLILTDFGKPVEVAVKVPTVSKSLDSDKACALITNQGLKCEIVDDNDSAEDKGKFTRQEPAAGTELDKGETVKVYFSTGPAEGKIPDKIIGITLDDAKKTIKDAGFVISSGAVKTVDCVDPTTLTGDVEKNVNDGACVTASNMIAGSNPSIGSSAKKGSTVTLFQASGEAVLPKLNDKTKMEAEAILTAMKLKFKDGEEIIDDKAKPGTVIKQTPVAGTSVAIGGEILLQYAKAVEKITVPSDLVNREKSYAEGKLSGLGLVPEFQDGDVTTDKSLDGKVESVDGAGTGVVKGATVIVKLWIYKAPTPATPIPPTNPPTGSPSSNSGGAVDGQSSFGKKHYYPGWKWNWARN